MPNPWSRQRDAGGNLEPMRWYARFERYRLLGPSRSMLGCYKDYVNQERPEKSPPTYVPTAWRNKAEQWHWQERAEAWDEENLAQARADNAAWAAQWRQREKDIATKLLDRALDMLRFPLAQMTRTSEDGTTTIVMPADWKASDVRAYAESASKLARLAAELNTEQVQVNVGDIDSAIETELARLAGLAEASDASPLALPANTDTDDGDPE